MALKKLKHLNVITFEEFVINEKRTIVIKK